MYLEITTPEKQIFQGEVDAVQFPGKDGLFQVLSNHAPIVASLTSGTIKINLNDNSKTVNTLTGEIVHDPTDDKIARVEIKGGVVEMMNNNIIVLAD